ncbi:hypothetical protein [Chthonobacter rhizosphaerae]|uniref:hypothetical protein n=1 Tax=Chthonobacter rhizosphaerae TaxID=2735553 RepID=UPI0015EF697D|nr:hypothetical protein [Chthonobacter rhizosphaerae]
MSLHNAWKLGVDLGEQSKPFAPISVPSDALLTLVPQCPAESIAALSEDLSRILGDRSVRRGTSSSGGKPVTPSDIKDALLQIENGSKIIASGFLTLAQASSRSGQAESAYGEHVRAMMEDLGAALFFYLLGGDWDRNIFEENPFLKDKLPWARVTPNGQTQVNRGFAHAFQRLSENAKKCQAVEIPNAVRHLNNDRVFVNALARTWELFTGRKPTVNKNEAFPSKFHRLYAFLAGYEIGFIRSTLKFEREEARQSINTFEPSDPYRDVARAKVQFINKEIAALTKMQLPSAATLRSWLREGY